MLRGFHMLPTRSCMIQSIFNVATMFFELCYGVYRYLRGSGGT
jgi:hypothetical protein